jgi:hypothetical protein
MAVHIFNCSVDTPDAQPDYVPEDLSYNDMESVSEIVLEKVLEINNAVAEHEENDTDDGNGFDLKKEIVFYYQRRVENKNLFYKGVHIIDSIQYNEQYSSQFHPEIVPPPPKA